MADPWIITPAERVKHNEQFQAIGPINGFITGEQAKGLFMQSTLPPQVLGVIWMLSDMDGDGKMNQNEFSIACKLINMKLRGFNLPPALSPAMKQSAIMGGASAPAAIPPNILAYSIAQPVAQVAPVIPAMPASQPIMNAALISTPAVVPPMVSATQSPLIPLDQSTYAITNVPRRPSQDSGSGSISGMEWGIPQPSKLKFTQVFNMSDRAKSGFLSGAQARNILIQSQLPHQALAQIWALSDVDNDGRLSSEEFVLAMYLCEQAKAGHPVPTVLPPDLIPPTLRRSRTSSIQSSGSLGTPNEGPLSPTSALLADTSFEDRRRENYEKGQAELERRRKTLLDAQRRETEERLRREREEESKREKARQEAERKRQEELEIEMQRQKEVESLKEADRRRQEETKEQARKEAERQRQEEWEKQRLLELSNVRQRQQENLLALKAKNQSLTIDLKSKEDEVKGLTDNISQTRIAVTEVKATIDGMRSTRDTYMSNMNELKAQARDQNQRLLNLNQEKARLKARSIAAAGASGAETAAVDASVTNKQMVIKQLQEKLDEITKEMDLKDEDVNNNVIELNTLKEQMQLTGERCQQLFTEFSAKRNEVLTLREKLLNPDAAWADAPVAVSESWKGQQRASVAEAPPARPPPPTKSSPDEGQTPSSGPTLAALPPMDAFASSNTTSLTNSTTAPTDLDTETALEAAETGQMFQALYQFESRNHDELSFEPGDIIVVVESTGAEEGWLSGKLNGRIGWFPEAYCTPYVGDSVTSAAAPITHQQSVISTTEEVVVPVAAAAAPEATTDGFRELGKAVAMFDWRGSQKNKLSLSKTDKIIVREQLDNWYFGDKAGVSGWFPKTYVKMVSGPLATASVMTPDQAPAASDMPEGLDHDATSDYYQALYPYQSEEPGDLIFEAGEVILVIRKDGDWWQGVIESRFGVFPSNYLNLDPLKLPCIVADIPESQVNEAVEVEKPFAEILAEKLKRAPTLEDSPRPLSEMTIHDVADLGSLKANQDDNEEENKEISELTKSPRSPKTYGKVSKKLDVAQVIAPYDATTPNQLSLVRGQMVSVRKKTDSGWWEGELHAKGKKKEVGWFPASYVKVMCGSARTTPVSMEMTGRDDDYAVEFPPDATAVIINKEVVAEPKPIQSTFERVEALYPYAAVNDDELTFEPGDVIMVLDKEDSAWWKGSLRGQIGVFPSNYVQPKSMAQTASATITSPDIGDSLCFPWSPNPVYSWTVPDSENPRQNQNQMIENKHRQNVINELLTTEANYLNDLVLVQECFIKPMQLNKVTESHVDTIFINWTELTMLSSVFNKALRVRSRNSPGGVVHMISDILCQQLKLLTPYTRFCSLQMKGSALFNQKFEEGAAWADVIKKCQEHPRVGGHTLTSFLMKPMQRITKYPLLIKKLLSCTPETHADYTNTQEALLEAQTLCKNVDECASEQDNTSKLEWMQSHILCEGLRERLIFNSLTNNVGPRKLLHAGVIVKTKSKKELLAFLMSDILLLCTSNKSLKTTLSLAVLELTLANTKCVMYRQPMFLTELRAQEDPDSDTGFHVLYNDFDLQFSATTSNERNNWLKKISLAQKHIKDTDKSLMQRRQSKENMKTAVGRLFISIVSGCDLEDGADALTPLEGILSVCLRGATVESKGNAHWFCEVSLGSQIFKTGSSTSSTPKWNFATQFIVKNIAEDVLCLTLYEKGFFRPDEFKGRAELRLQGICHQPDAKDQYTVEPKVLKVNLQEVKKGQIILKISFQKFHS